MQPGKLTEVQGALLEELQSFHLSRIAALFDIVEAVRFATEDSGIPHLPIGTAQLLDTVELFITRNLQDKHTDDNPDYQLDWAASVKLAPLFESDVVGPEQLSTFARGLAAPFSNQLRRELLVIAASGMHFVPQA
jgi:hypothetical protein